MTSIVGSSPSIQLIAFEQSKQFRTVQDKYDDDDDDDDDDDGDDDDGEVKFDKDDEYGEKSKPA